jgi:hypothetical protein
MWHTLSTHPTQHESLLHFIKQTMLQHMYHFIFAPHTPPLAPDNGFASLAAFGPAAKAAALRSAMLASRAQTYLQMTCFSCFLI